MGPFSEMAISWNYIAFYRCISHLCSLLHTFILEMDERNVQNILQPCQNPSPATKNIWTSLKSETMFKLYTHLFHIFYMLLPYIDNFDVDAATAAGGGGGLNEITSLCHILTTISKCTCAQWTSSKDKWMNEWMNKKNIIYIHLHVVAVVQMDHDFMMMGSFCVKGFKMMCFANVIL